MSYSQTLSSQTLPFSYVHKVTTPLNLGLPRDLTVLRDSMDLRRITGLDVSQDSRTAEYRKILDQLRSSDVLNTHFRLERYLSVISPPPLTHTDLFSLSQEKLQALSASTDLLRTCIPEDSLLRKLLTCIPLVGIIPALINERSLEIKISKPETNNYKAKLVTIKNHYKICSVIREILSLALIVNQIAVSAFNWPIGICAGIIAVSSVAFNVYGIYKNTKLINDLQANNQISSDIEVW